LFWKHAATKAVDVGVVSFKTHLGDRLQVPLGFVARISMCAQRRKSFSFFCQCDVGAGQRDGILSSLDHGLFTDYVN
jgi:hypothetical protein